MNKRRLVIIVIGGMAAVSLLVAGTLLASGADFGLWWHAIPGGGGRSTSADYVLDGSAGQPAAGALSGEDLRLDAGFWSGIGAEAPTPTPTGSPSPTPTGSPSPTATPTGSPSPTVTPTGSPLPTSSPTATSSPSATPTPTGTPLPQCQELLTNGDFETGSLSPWGSSGDIGLGSGHNSAYGAALGGTDDAHGELLQGVTIPPGASSVDLAFWWLAESAGEQPGDAVDVAIQYGEQADHLDTLPAVEPIGQWQKETLDLSAYAGMDVAVTFLVHTDAEGPTTFRLDDVSLEACGLTPPTPTSTPTATATPSTTEERIYLPVVLKGSPGA